MKSNKYYEPEFTVVITGMQDVLTLSGGDDFNMLGDQKNNPYFINDNWTIEI